MRAVRHVTDLPTCATGKDLFGAMNAEASLSVAMFCLGPLPPHRGPCQRLKQTMPTTFEDGKQKIGSLHAK